MMRFLAVLCEEAGIREVVNLDTVAKVEDFPAEERVCVTFVDRFESNYHGPGRDAFVYALLRELGMMLGHGHLAEFFAGTAGHARWVKERAELVKAICEAKDGSFIAPGRHGEPLDEVSTARSISAQVGDNIAAGGTPVSYLRDEVSTARVEVQESGGAVIVHPDSAEAAGLPETS